MLVEAAYVGTKGTHLTADYAANLLIPAGYDPRNPESGALVCRCPDFGKNNPTGQGSSSTYNSFRRTVKMRVTAGMVQLSTPSPRPLATAATMATVSTSALVSLPGRIGPAPGDRLASARSVLPLSTRAWHSSR